MKKEIEVMEWDDEISCPKCGRTKSNEGLNFRILVTHPDILFIMCNRCGYEWFMETFPE